MADPLSTLLGAVVGAITIGAPAVALYVRKSGEAKDARADAVKLEASAELARAETQREAQKIIAEQLGAARGDLVAARDRLDAAESRYTESVAKHTDCEERVDACEEKHNATTAALNSERTERERLAWRIGALQRHAGVSDERLRSLSPPGSWDPTKT